MKNIILLIIITSFLILAAQDPSGSLDLGDVIIEGDSDLIKDSLGTSYDLDSLLKVSEKEKFLYKPEPVLEKSSEQAAFLANRMISLEAKGGNYTFGSLKAALSFNPFLNFNFDLYNRSLKKDWNTFEMGANWIPCYKEFQFNAGGEYLKYESEITDTEVKDFSFGIKRVRTSKTEKIDIPQFSISSLYYQIDQVNRKLYSFDIRSNINLDISLLTIDSNVEYLKENVQGDLTVYLNKLPVNRLGLYLHYRPELYSESGKVMFSIDFFNRINLFNSLFLNVSNTPSITKNSYLDDLKKDKFQEPVTNTNQTSTLINPELSIEYFGPVYLKGSFRFSMNEDHYLFIPDTTGLYRLVNYTDVEHQELGLLISFRSGKFEIGNDLIYSEYEVKERISEDVIGNYAENIPYTPEIKNTTYINLSYLNWKLGIKNDYLYGRENELGDKMPDVNLLNAYLSFQLIKDLEIIGEVENIMDEEYIRSSYLPVEGLQFKAGFRWSY